MIAELTVTSDLGSSLDKMVWMGSGSRCSLGLKVQDLRIDLRNGLVDRVVIRIFICEDYMLLFVMLMFDLDLCLIVGVCDIPPCKDHCGISSFKKMHCLINQNCHKVAMVIFSQNLHDFLSKKKNAIGNVLNYYTCRIGGSVVCCVQQNCPR
jgi:hypothetical protein